MVQSPVCSLIGPPADFPVLSVPDRRDILMFINYLRLQIVGHTSYDALYDIVAERFVSCVQSRGFSPAHRTVKISADLTIWAVSDGKLLEFRCTRPK